MKAWVASGMALAMFGAVSIGSIAPTFAGDKAAVQGSFEGRSRHITTGGVEIKKSGDGYVVVLGKDFSLDGAPDPKIGFVKDGVYDDASTFAILDKNTGAQTYAKATYDPAKHNEVYIWCEKFAVPLGVVGLN
jgi:hypothetical protein